MVIQGGKLRAKTENIESKFIILVLPVMVERNRVYGAFITAIATGHIKDETQLLKGK